MRDLILCSLAVALLGGCLYQNMSPATKLRDSVEAGNEGARWGRMDIAAERVAPEYARDYANRHYDWGDGIQLADLDILGLVMAEDEDSAKVTVAFSWYSYDDMSLQRTVVRQSWRSSGGSYILTDEEVIDGDDRLLEPDPDAEDDEDEAEEEDGDDADEEDELSAEEEELASEDDADSDGDDDDDDEEWIDEDDREASEPPTLARAT